MPPGFLLITCLFDRHRRDRKQRGPVAGGRKPYRSITLRMGRYFYRQWRDELTPAGKCLVWSICVTGLGTVTIQMPIYQVFCGLVTLLAVSAAAGFVFRPRVEIGGAFPETAVAGRPLTATFLVRNLRLIPAYDLGLGLFGLPEAFEAEPDIGLVSRLGPRQTVPLDVTFTPRRRGRYELPDLRAYSTFPFYIGRSGKAGRELPPLLVLPRFEPLAGLSLAVGSRHQPGGMSLTSRVGESPEYIGNREYLPGEPVRRLDFRAWARTGRPVVREYQEEYYSRVALILDTHIAADRRPAGPDGYPELEAAVSLTAAVAAALSDGEYVIDLFAAGPQLHVFRSGRHTAHMENVLEILAGIEPSRGEPFDQLGPAVGEELTRVAAAVVVLLDWDEPRRRLCEQIVESGCRLTTVFVAADTDRAATAAAAVPEAVILSPADIARGGLELR